MIAAPIAPLVPIVIIGAVALAIGTAGRVTLTLDGDTLCVRLGTKDALLALRRELLIPVTSVKGVAVAPRRLVPQTGLRLPGTSLPGVIRAGSYGTGERRDFWLVRRAAQLLVIELEPGQPYRRLVLEVPDPHAEALRLRPALGTYAGTFDAR